MRILACNSGSSSLKFSLFEAEQELLLAEDSIDWTTRRFDFLDIRVIERRRTNVACRQYVAATRLATHFNYGTRSAKRSEEGKMNQEIQDHMQNRLAELSLGRIRAPLGLCLSGPQASLAPARHSPEASHGGLLIFCTPPQSAMRPRDGAERQADSMQEETKRTKPS